MQTTLHTLYETVQNYFQQVITKFAKCVIETNTKIAQRIKSHHQVGATLDFLLFLKANKEMFEQIKKVSFL
jgi:GMP synthase PP-ATPase subunit